MRILTVGEILWDVFPDGTEHLGGAPFNFSVNARRLGHEAAFLSAVGEDDRGRRALAGAAALGLSTEWMKTVPEETGRVDVRLDEARQPHFTLHRPAAYDRLRLTGGEVARLAAWDPDWICHGTLFFVYPHAVETLRSLIAACPRARLFCDINLRPGAWSPELVRQLISGADVVKMNESEEAEFGAVVDAPVRCVTRAERGCELWIGVDHAAVPGIRVDVADAVGAGDAFSAALLHGLAQGWPARRVADFANRVGALVASRRGPTPEWTLAEVEDLRAG